MNFIISSTTLLKNVQAISGVLSSNNPLPILDNFLFNSDGEQLKITASDQETTIVTTIKPEKINNSGKIVVPAKLLIDWLKTLSDIPVTFNINENNVINISSGEGIFNMSGFDADEYPELQKVTEMKQFRVTTELLKSAITKTLFAAGNDTMRPQLSGILCEVETEKITFVATDAHKLVRYIRTDAHADEPISFILPKKPLKQLQAIIGICDEDDVQVRYNNKQVEFIMGDFVLTCLQIEARYPNYAAVIPTDNPNILLVDRLHLINTLQRVSIFANPSTNIIRLRVSGQELSVMAEDFDYSTNGHERLQCNYSGEDMDIGFNAKSLIEMLTSINCETARIELSQPSRAGLIFPNEEENQNENILMLVMPIILNS